MTYENILKRCLEKIPSDIDKREGSMIFTAISPICYEIANAYFNISTMLDQTYIGTAYGEYLDLICNSFGVIRKQAEKCSKKALIITSNDILEQKFTCDSYIFIVTEKLDDNTYIIEAEDFGSEYDDIFGELIPILNISDIEIATIIENYIYSSEIEDDESLRERAIERVFYKPFSGNIADYTEKATSIEGVSYVSIFTADILGEQNVHLVLLDAQKGSVSQDILDYCDEYFNGTDTELGIAPIGHNVSFSTCDFKDISISVTIKVSNDAIFENVKQLTIANVQNYIDNIDFDSIEIAVSRILASILENSQILDAYSVLINEQNSNFILEKSYTNFEIANVINIEILKG